MATTYGPVTPVDGNAYFGVTEKTVGKRQSELNMASFLQLLTTQLANQNPLEPMKDTDFYAQLAQLGTVQGLDDLKGSMEITQANSMIGKVVTAARPNATDTDTSVVFGVVRGMNTRNGTHYLQVQEQDGGVVEIEVANVQSIADAPATSSLDTMVGIANSAQFIGKTLTAPHPTLKDADGKAETLTGVVTKVSFENGAVYLHVTDRLQHSVKVNLQSVESFTS